MDSRQFDRLTKGLATVGSRRRVLRGLAAGAAGAAGLALGRGAVEAAPNPCNAAGSLIFPPGPGRAAFQQVCKQCDADFTRICESGTAPGAFICCPSDAPCLFNCETNRAQCGGCEESTVPECAGTCANTCCQEP